MGDNVFSFLLSGSLSDLSDFIFDLECHESLVIENFAGRPPVEAEMRVAEVHKRDDAGEQEHPRVVTLGLLLEGIVSQLVTIGLIMHLGVLLESHRESITGEVVTVAI